MITVRFPSGFSIQYNSANYVSRGAHGYSDLLIKKDGGWVAQVPNDCVIEFTPPCRTYNAIEQRDDQLVQQLAREVNALRRLSAKLRKEKAP